MNIFDMSLDELRNVPHRDWNEDIGPFESLVIVPATVSAWDLTWFNIKSAVAKWLGLDEPEIWRIPGMRDSGYLCMSFVAADEHGEPIAKLGGCSDVVHIDGIGGYGENWLKEHGGIPDRVDPRPWSIDALPNSGCLRLFSRGPLTVGSDLSSFEVYSHRENDRLDERTD